MFRPSEQFNKSLDQLHFNPKPYYRGFAEDIAYIINRLRAAEKYISRCPESIVPGSEQWTAYEAWQDRIKEGIKE